ncbi:hypothetical protein Tdes44962_MAKER07463 [Teratosphaeria destructans]|uniref:Uncharacterized protein n=1 Tax=Teratosphaeria destructans TaxID=418781 RepID=A0A9W7SYT1_9PEZI|nr:hypothetical protein Tdes44962_MAKER07463 [Teratosphaeria destructans]
MAPPVASNTPSLKNHNHHSLRRRAEAHFQPLAHVPRSTSPAPQPISPRGRSPPGKRTLWQRSLKRLQATWPCLVVTKVDSTTGYCKRELTLNPGRRLQKRHKPIYYNRPPGLDELAVGDQGRHPGIGRTYSFDDLSLVASGASTSRAPSIFGISGFINDFAHQIERSFLSPLEETIYRRMLHITGPGRHRHIPHSDLLILIMDDQDSASAAAAICYTIRPLLRPDRQRLYMDLEKLLTTAQKVVLKHILFNNVEIRCTGHESRCQTPDSVAEPVLRYAPARSLTYGEAPRMKSRDVLTGRSNSSTMILNQAHSQLIDRRRPVPRTGGEYGGVFSRREITSPHAPPLTSASETDLRTPRLSLRGGGDDGARSKLERAASLITSLSRRARESQFFRPHRLGDDERPNAALWWFAGGKLDKCREHWHVPCAATLRERKALEQENRAIVGFWGTVRGAREVKRTRAGLEDVCRQIQGGGVEGSQDEAREVAKEEDAIAKKEGAEGDATGCADGEADQKPAEEEPKDAEGEKGGSDVHVSVEDNSKAGKNDEEALAGP